MMEYSMGDELAQWTVTIYWQTPLMFAGDLHYFEEHQIEELLELDGIIENLSTEDKNNIEKIEIIWNLSHV
jgi:hypothetical protein